ncbi:PTS system mannose/fructose/sorbose family transporter subunit IID [Lactobacillus kimbladii]|uniref:PTS system mannose/fructose/sorbose family transporter subunit IID n=1 Tax=Lactobacillus kimbladii TaxID=1218506 RepID=UPI0021C6D01C|nr:PTS system mannose/fructose/sorbose family transporter subunit IID [Lactobacillus kimbladii]
MVKESQFCFTDILDQLFKGLIPLLITVGCFYLLRKRVNINWVILGIFVLSIFLGLIGVV